MFGAGGGTSSYAEIEETDVILLWGSNARETHPIFFHHLLKGVRNGARLHVVDPRRTPSAQWADRWLGLREQSQARAPELVEMIDSHLTTPDRYDLALTLMKRMLDAQQQPSLDAWLRVHAEGEKFALVFRDIRREAGSARATMPYLEAVG